MKIRYRILILPIGSQEPIPHTVHTSEGKTTEECDQKAMDRFDGIANVEANRHLDFLLQRIDVEEVTKTVAHNNHVNVQLPHRPTILHLDEVVS